MLVSPSLLAANFGCLDREIDMINASNADMLHLDVMDGVFVPNISFGFPVIEAVAKRCQKPLDIHLMITSPHQYIAACRDVGAHSVNVHQEACVHLDRVIHMIQQAGMKAAVTLNPATPVEMLRDIIGELYMVLIMSVNPGFGGQKFIANTLNKVRRVKEMIAETGSNALVEVDGGINLITGAEVAAAGADVLVAGSYVFGAADPMRAIDELKNL